MSSDLGVVYFLIIIYAFFSSLLTLTKTSSPTTFKCDY